MDKALQALHDQDLAQLHLSGLILHALVSRAVLTGNEARGILQEAITHLQTPRGAVHQEFVRLHDAFQ